MGCQESNQQQTADPRTLNQPKIQTKSSKTWQKEELNGKKQLSNSKIASSQSLPKPNNVSKKQQPKSSLRTSQLTTTKPQKKEQKKQEKRVQKKEEKVYPKKQQRKEQRKNEQKSLRSSSQSLGKSAEKMQVSPSKVRLSVNQIPQQGESSIKRKKKASTKKSDAKLQEFMKVYGL